MDALTCLKKLGYVSVLDFATVDEDGAPQVRNISAIHFEGTDIYFLTARGKYFASQLKRDGRMQILCYTKYKETIRLSGKAIKQGHNTRPVSCFCPLRPSENCFA